MTQKNRPDDSCWMRRAISLSQRGYPAPNPHVGCVLVRDGKLVGEGWHEYAGGPHAERVALAKAGKDAKGATAYVTLEPCNHFGRTPPCSEGLIEAGVTRVVIAVRDPNPVAAGGIERLADAGMEVTEGIETENAKQLNSMWLTAIERKRPFVVGKAAASLDGRIALPSGESQWITCPEARRVGHRLRALCGAVLVGRRTVEMDNPQLTARIPGVVNQPVRIVLDPSSKLSGKERVFDDSAETLHITGNIVLPELMATLFERKIRGLLVEGGAATLSRFIESALVDQLELFYGAKLLGDGPSWIGSLNISSLPDAPLVEIIRQSKVGSDLWVTARFKEKL